MEPPATSGLLFWLFNVAVAGAAAALTIYCARARQGTGTYLCDDCRFNDALSCQKKERPFALACTSYRDVASAGLRAAAAITEGTTASTVENSGTEYSTARAVEAPNAATTTERPC